MITRSDWPEVGHDDLDLPTGPPTSRSTWWASRRLTLGATPTSTPVLLFVAIGVALGAHGLDLLSTAAIMNSQALVWVGLAVIGVFIGLGLDSSIRTSGRPVLFMSAVIACATLGIMALGTYLIATQAAVPLPGEPVLDAALVALCTSVSAAVPVSSCENRELARAAHFADLDDVPIVIGGLLVLAILSGDLPAWRIAATVAAGAALGLSGCLLFSRASDTERGLFVTGTVLLLAGAAAYLGTSPLASGCVAAIVWSRVPGTADRITAEDLRVLHHPLMVVVLVFAGAAMEFTLAAVWMAAIVIVLRLTAKLLVSVLVSRRAATSPVLLASVLLQPGLLGVGLAMNAWLLAGDEYRWLMSTVTLATIASEFLALFQPRPVASAA